MGGFFLLIGTFMLIDSGAGWKDFLFSFGPMMNLLTLFAMVPILALPIKIGKYEVRIRSLIKQKVKSSSQLYSMTSGISYFFSIFLNLATLPMTYYSIRPATDIFSLQDKERFMSRAITHGFAMPLMWAPVTPIVGIVIEMTGVSWASMLPYVLPLSIAGLLLDWMLGKSNAKKQAKQNLGFKSENDEIAAASEASEESVHSGRLYHILIAIIIFNLLVSVFETQFSFSFLILVALLVIPFTLLWSLCIRKTKAFGIGLKEHFQTHLPKMKDQFFIFLSAGFFISSIQFSGTDHVLNQWISAIKDIIGIEVFLIVLLFIPLALAFTGLHPAVGLALMAEALDPQGLGISPYILTTSMLAGSVAAFLMGPYNATIGVMSNIVKVTSFRISKWNVSFTLLFLGFCISYLIFLEILI